MDINVSLGVNGRLTADEGKLLQMAEHFDKFLVNWEMTHPNVWRDRIVKGAFNLFNGTSQKTNVFRGTLGPQQGLNTWNRIAVSSKPAGASPGVDACQYNPQTYNWAFESFDFTGYNTSWRSPAFCVNDLKYVDYAKEQLGMIIHAGSMVTDATKETFNRETYVKMAVDAGKGVVLAEGAMGYVDTAAVRFSYDPFTVDADGDTYVEFAASMLPRLSALNWTFLDQIRAYMSDQCPDAAQSSEGGMPVFGLMIDYLDFERFVMSDAALREDFRMAIPQRLIKGFNMDFRVYRGFALFHDVRQMRFSPSTITAGGNIRCKRVVPRRATRAGTIGYIPEANPDYITAEIGMGVIFLAEALQILVPPTINNLGAGMTFGPAPDFNGSWSWLNIADPYENPLREKGYFFARFEYWVKPLRYASEATVFLYRRCPQAISSGCAVEAQAAAKTSSFIAVATAEADFSSTLRTVTLTLASVITAGAGDRVNITKDDGNAFPAYVIEDHAAPIYTFAWENGATNAPSAYTDMNDPAITKVTVA